jgi:hypothetical protein
VSRKSSVELRRYAVSIEIQQERAVVMHEGLKSDLRLGVVTAGMIGRTEHFLI